MSNIKYRYYGDRSKSRHNGIITAAYIYDKKNNKIRIGLAFCSPKDKFNKRIGREIAKGRLERNKHITVYNVKNKPSKEVDSVVKSIVTYVIGPSWLKKFKDEKLMEEK